jgi:5-methylcytosine-specific restriction endonuclease McrA
MHHNRSNYIIQIKTICRECNRKVPNDLDKYSDYGLLSFLNNLLIKADCLPLDKESLEIELN